MRIYRKDRYTEHFFFKEDNNILNKIARKNECYKGKVQNYYTKWYHHYFKNIRFNKLNILEIGVGKGASLKTWKEYFVNSNIYGIEKESIVIKKNLTKGCKIFVGDQANEYFLEYVCKKVSNGFDIIIDDGSHFDKDRIKSFEFLFKELNNGGIYVVENLQVSYKEKYKNMDEKYNMIKYLKKIIDNINYNGRFNNNNFLKISKKHYKLSYYEKKIVSVHFFAGICFIFKRLSFLKKDKRKKKMEKISIIGIGKLGLCFALTLEKAGYDVLGCDIKKNHIDLINNKKFKTIEPGVEKCLENSKNFRATLSLKEIIKHSDLIFITVKTTSLLDGSYDCSQVDKVVDDIKIFGIQKNIKHLVISCNVNPGYSDKVSKSLKKYNYIVSYNPEWIAQGSILHDQSYPDIVVIGEDNEIAGNIIEDIYKNICLNEPVFHRMNRISAEITKISLNCYLTVKISMANMIGDVAVKAGVDPNKILMAVGDDTRVGNKYIKYGFGYGGPCLHRDTRAFIHYANRLEIKPSMIMAAEEINKNHLEFQLNEFFNNNSKNKLIIFNSITYKKGVILIEESQQLLYAVGIARNGYKVLIKEHINVIKQIKEIYGNLFEYENKLNDN